MFDGRKSGQGVYGFTITVDDRSVTFHGKGLLAKMALLAGEHRILFSEITDRSLKPAKIIVNGRIEVATGGKKSIFYFRTGKQGRAAQDAFELIVERTPAAGIETAGHGQTTNRSKQETKAAKAQAKRDRTAEIREKYGSVVTVKSFDLWKVAIYNKGFIRVGLFFILGSTQFEALRSIGYSRSVKYRSYGLLTISTSIRTRTLNA